MDRKLIRFDWAVKKLLRHKANFGILEGFLSELLKFDVKVETILESEANKETEYDKFNRVDILVRSEQQELILVEIQNDSEKDYFHRMLYGVSKLVTQYIKEGEAYGTIKKIYSINIVYFGLGQGADYVYEYRGAFVGLHNGDILEPTSVQKEAYRVEKVSDIFPKYFVLKVNNFNDIAKDTLDEWIYFLKNSEVKEGFKAKGLEQAKEKLRYENLSTIEKEAYQRYQENRRIEKSVVETAVETAISEGIELGIGIGIEKGIQKGMEEGIQKGMEKGIELSIKKIAENAILAGLDNTLIANLTGLSNEQIEILRALMK